MTPPERSSAAHRPRRPSQGGLTSPRPRRPLRALAVAGGAAGLAGAGIGAVALVPSGAGATSIRSLRSRAASIARRIDTVQTKLQILSEEYDQARTRAATLTAAVHRERAALARSRRAVTTDEAALRRQAIEAYVAAGSESGIALSGDPNALPLQQTYLAVASSSLDTAVTSLHDSEHRLDVRRATLAADERKAEQAAAVIGTSRSRAQALEGQLTAAQASVSGQLAAAVAAEEAAQQAAAQAAAAATARQAAAEPPVAGSAPQPSPASPTTPAGLSAPSVPASGAGAAAVSAAETQLGVPYVWGGSTPGAGFDCSGLAMWAWSRAGVNLPHSAQAQYDSIEHIPFSDLQPGDLVFYASGGYIYHVVMYIGGGRAIQAEETGIPISITPLWPGAYAAGRP